MAGGWLSWVRANDNRIMALLEDQVGILVKATSVLADSISNYSTLKEKNSILKELEHEGDQFTHKLFTIIDKTFITPLDKEDISELTSTIDQVLDATYGTSDRLVLFKIQEPSRYMQELANLLLTASQQIFKAVTELRKTKHQNLLDYCKAISSCEHEGDKVYRIAIAELFETQDAVEIIKCKEVYETLEGALDRTRDVADVIEDIALKYR
jgi:predicted phosphate transport protein (TIGR00153 family)